ncbi:MAG: right-handed parallel beta-helix repeat-containing protein [Thermodesulfobacteria bacterium]|nr:right-handed parallel beta-helix repeat-containing protein [Thermodesulfobacteriota bacterium]
MKKVFLFLFLFFSFYPVNSEAITWVSNTWYVKPDGSDPVGCTGGDSWQTAFATIQKAIDCSQDGDQIWVAQGTYSLSWSINLNKAVALYGGFSGNETSLDERDWESHKTIVDGNGQTRCFYVTANGRIDGFDIRNGRLLGQFNGAAVFNQWDIASVIANCNIYNHEAWEGGAIYNGIRSSVSIINCKIYQNRAHNGGGIYNADESKTTIRYCDLFDNSADYYGGAILNHYSEPTIEYSNIYRNRAGWYSGAIQNHSYDDKSPVSPIIRNCNIYDNNATEYNGGAIESYYANPIIENCNIFGNKAKNGNGGAIASRYSSHSQIINCNIHDNEANYGGGIYNENSSPQIENSIIHDNVANNRGGGIGNHGEFNNNITTIVNCNIYDNSADWSGGGIHNAGSTPLIVNSNIVNNEVTSSAYDYKGGGGVYSYNSASTTIINSILWGNLFLGSPSQIESYNSTLSVTYSNIQGGYQGTGNIDTDPSFSEPDSGDFHLLLGSPCIDAGNNNASSLPETDFEGDFRILDGNMDGNSIVDMGADEFVFEPPVYELELGVAAEMGSGGWIWGQACCGDYGECYEFQCSEYLCVEEIQMGCSVQMEAIAYDDSVFMGWGGDCYSGSYSEAYIDYMDGDKQCVAFFSPLNFPPSEPTNPSPENGATGVPYENTTFSWQASDPDGDPLTYTFYLCGFWDPEIGCMDTVADVSGLRTPMFTLDEPLSPGHEYMWYVEACDASECVKGPYWTFVTEASPEEQLWMDITDEIAQSRSRTLYDRLNRVFFTLIDLTNNSGFNIQGPIRMVLFNNTLELSSNGPGIHPDGYTEDGHPYFIIVPEGSEWNQGATIEDLRVDFAISRERLDFDLKFEVLVSPQVIEAPM